MRLFQHLVCFWFYQLPCGFHSFINIEEEDIFLGLPPPETWGWRIMQETSNIITRTIAHHPVTI